MLPDDLPHVPAAFVVGGTAHRARAASPAATCDGDALERAAGILQARRAPRSRDVTTLDPERARLLPAGLVILRDVAARLGAPGRRSGAGGIREGVDPGRARATTRARGGDRVAKARPVDVQADMPFEDAARETIAVRAPEMLSFVEGTILGEDIEELHSLRVSCRRLRAALEVYAPCFKRKRHREVLDIVKDTADARQRGARPRRAHRLPADLHGARCRSPTGRACRA